jgi:hypothetical protein
MRIKAAGGDPNTDLICSKCKAVKDARDFHNNPTNVTGHNRWCKVCVSVYDTHRRELRKSHHHV